MTHSIIKADAVEFFRAQPKDSIDLVFGSPPYEDARLYLEGGRNLGIAKKTEAWVAWMVEVYRAASEACNGLVAFVVGHGKTRGFSWTAAPSLLEADLKRAGLVLRNPPAFHRVGISGSGGPDWLRADHERIVCVTRPGRLKWSDNTAMGHPPKWAPGGEMSHRVSDGTRVNQWGPVGGPNGAGKRFGNKTSRPSHKTSIKRGVGTATRGSKDGDVQNGHGYNPPVLANPGNVIKLTVGGGQMGGDQFASLNEAPFPEKLAEFFILSFCPPAGVVCDPFSGSGTTAAMAKKNGRSFVGCDLRQSQVDLGLKRLALQPKTLFA